MAITLTLTDSTPRQGSTAATSSIASIPVGSNPGADCVLEFNTIRFSNRTASSATFTPTSGSPIACVITGNATPAGYTYTVLVPAASFQTTGTLAVTYTGGTDRLCLYGVYQVVGAASATPSASMLSGTGGGGTINVSAGGLLLSRAYAGSSQTWTGATADATTTSPPGSGGAMSVASFLNTGSAITGRTVTYGSGAGEFVSIVLDAGGGPPPSIQKSRGFIIG